MNDLEERYWCSALDGWVQVIERRVLFGKSLAKVVVDGGKGVQTVPAESLLSDRPFDLPAALSVVAGARIREALGSDLFLAPLVSKALPLPHQFRALRKALSVFPVRVMLADEVGMGKTIEAGLVFKELKLRGIAERTLVLAPKSLLLQWISEMEELFGETFELVQPGNWGTDSDLRQENLWKRHKQVVASVDSVKPKESQKGWTREKIAKYNLSRFYDLIGAGWDLVIIDESHKVAGASEDVSRFELAKELALAIPHVLLLTATPHSGKSDAFRRLLSLLDPDRFGGTGPLSKEQVESAVIRTEKRSTTDADGKPLFAPRTTRLVSVAFEPKHALQQRLYEEVSSYVVEGYNKSLATGDKGSRLLLILLQRLMSSSTLAIRRFLEQRAEALSVGIAPDIEATEEELSEDEDVNVVAQRALFTVQASGDERREVLNLLDLALSAERAGPDARAEALYAQMIRIAQEDSEPSKKYLIFTEFVSTQSMLAEYLGARGYSVSTLNGSMNLEERKAAVDAFRNESQVLICTDAGGEGLNMQFAHVVFNYDLPYNPMRVEQRIGRVDRIGQKREVRAINLALENSVEARLYDIWQVKLALILEEYGVDKTGDVLDSAAAGAEFEKLARTAILNPKGLEEEFDRMATDLRKAAESAKKANELYSGSVDEDDKPPSEPFQAWLATMLAPKRSRQEGGKADALLSVIDEADDLSPFFAQGRPVPRLNISSLGFHLDGWFAVWKVGFAQGAWRQQRTFAIYVNAEGQSFSKAGLRLWDELSTGNVEIQTSEETMSYDFAELSRIAEEEAAAIFESIQSKTRNLVKVRLSALETSYLARRTSLSHVGVESIREARRSELQAEYVKRKAEITALSESLPDLECLFLARVYAE